MALKDIVNMAGEGFEGKMGLSVKHLGTGEAASLRGDDLFPTASVFKVPIIVELYRGIEAGVLSMDDKIVLMERDKVPGSGILKELGEGLELSVGDLTELMMILSDNTATDMLVERLGMENINATLRGLGLQRTRVVADCRDLLFDLIHMNDTPDEMKTIDVYRERSRGAVAKGSWSLGVERNNVTTPDEMLRLLEMIVNGEAVGRESCEAILETMGRCQTGQYMIGKYLPREAVDLAHKTGSLPGIRNDVGVATVRETGEKYIMSCFTMGASDIYAAEEAVAKASKEAFDYFTK